MILSDADILAALSQGLGIEPLNLDNVEPCSVDLTLQDVKGCSAGVGLDGQIREWRLPPGTFTLACTTETLSIPADLAAFVHGKSSWGRKGLHVHVTAGLIDPGFNGQIVLELYNCSSEPIVLAPGVKICQLVFHRLLTPSARPYGHSDRRSKYQNQSGIVGPREDK